MKIRCAGLAVFLVLLAAFSVGNAQVPFHGVIDPQGLTVLVDTAIVTTSAVDTFLTVGWGSGSGGMDTFDFPDLEAWPIAVTLKGTINGNANSSPFPDPEPETWYGFLWPFDPVPQAMFFSETGVEESRPAVKPQPCLHVSPSLVTSQMTVRVEATDDATVEVVDAVGNLVRTLDCTDGTATWCRDDGLGRLVPEGVYFCRYATTGSVAVQKVLVTH